MGKKSKDGTSDVLKTLFSAENPFRRKPQPKPAADPTPPPPTSNPNEKSDDGSHARNSNRKKISNPNPDEIAQKRKKLEASEVGEEKSLKEKKRKKKMDELEEGYERKRYGAPIDASEVHSEEEGVAAVDEERKADEASMETIATKEGFDDEAKLLRTVFVGNVPLTMKKKALLKEFAKFGEVESARIRSVPLVDTKIPRKSAIFKGKINDAVGSMHAYVVFKDEQSARASLSHNMAEVEGNHIRVDMASAPRKTLKGEAPLYERKKTVFVGNLPFDVKDEELYQLFCGLNQSESTVEAIRVIRDPHTSLGKGIAYVLFKSREAANSTCRRRDLKIRDRFLRVCHAKSEATPLKKGSELKGDFPHKRTVSSYRAPTPMKNEDKLKSAPLPYQGLRASKSGVLKKSSSHASQTRRNDSRPKISESTDKFVRKQKRPAVSLRKEKQLKKRKHEKAASGNTHLSKKPRKD